MNNLTLEQHNDVIEWQYQQLEFALNGLKTAEFKHHIERYEKDIKETRDRIAYLQNTPQEAIKYHSWELMSLNSLEWFKDNIKGSD
jgi:hypothetical protein